MTAAGNAVTVERTLTQADFDAFARLSGDDNPIHVDPVFAATTRFGRTVSHGMLLSTVFRGLLDRLVPGARQVSQQLMFPAPTFAGEPMRFSARVKSDDDRYVVAEIDCERIDDGVITCAGASRSAIEGRGIAAKAAPSARDGFPRWSASGSANEAWRHSASISRNTIRASRSAPTEAGFAVTREFAKDSFEIGQSAEVTRRFSMEDIDAYVVLGGNQPADDAIPEPLINALFSYLLGVRLPGQGTNYLKQESDFFETARVGEVLTASVEITRLRPEKQLVDLNTRCVGEDDKLVSRGRALVYVADVPDGPI